MQLRRILDGKGAQVITVEPDRDVASLVALLSEHRVGALVVSPDGNEVVGIVSERDVITALAARGPAVLDERVGALATARVHTAGPDSSVEQVMELMTAQRVRHVPVVDGQGTLAGIVSIGDVVKNQLGALAAERDALQSYVTSG